MKKTLYYCLLVTLILASACKKKSHLKGKNDSSINVTFSRFDQDFNQLNKTTDFYDYSAKLNEKYGVFYDIYNQAIIRLGDSESADYQKNAYRFLNDEIYKMVYDTVQTFYTELDTEEKILTAAFQNYNKVFPKRQIPAFYSHISGFNEPIVVADSVLSIGLDNYLGENHIFYKNLGTYTYLLPKKNRTNIAIDAMRGWLISEIIRDNVKSTLLDRMIEEGKLLYILSIIMPDELEYSIFGLSEKQYLWLEENELKLWTYAIEQKHLYTAHQITVAKYFNDGPFFNFFGSGSSPLVGKYLGWQIIKAYMDNNQNISIEDLLKIDDSQQILSTSGYRP